MKKIVAVIAVLAAMATSASAFTFTLKNSSPRPTKVWHLENVGGNMQYVLKATIPVGQTFTFSSPDSQAWPLVTPHGFPVVLNAGNYVVSDKNGILILNRATH